MPKMVLPKGTTPINAGADAMGMVGPLGMAAEGGSGLLAAIKKLLANMNIPETVGEGGQLGKLIPKAGSSIPSETQAFVKPGMPPEFQEMMKTFPATPPKLPPVQTATERLAQSGDMKDVVNRWRTAK